MKKLAKIGLRYSPRFVAVILALCVLAVFCLQSAVINFHDLSFENAKQIVSKNHYQETRLTSTGDKIQRFFTGMLSLPYQDYLILDKGKVPLRENTEHLSANVFDFDFSYITNSYLVIKQKVSSIASLPALIIQITTILALSLITYLLLPSILSRNKRFSVLYCVSRK